MSDDMTDNDVIDTLPTGRTELGYSAFRDHIPTWQVADAPNGTPVGGVTVATKR